MLIKGLYRINDTTVDESMRRLLCEKLKTIFSSSTVEEIQIIIEFTKGLSGSRVVWVETKMRNTTESYIIKYDDNAYIIEKEKHNFAHFFGDKEKKCRFVHKEENTHINETESTIVYNKAGKNRIVKSLSEYMSEYFINKHHGGEKQIEKVFSYVLKMLKTGLIPVEPFLKDKPRSFLCDIGNIMPHMLDFYNANIINKEDDTPPLNHDLFNNKDILKKKKFYIDKKDIALVEYNEDDCRLQMQIKTGSLINGFKIEIAFADIAQYFSFLEKYENKPRIAFEYEHHESVESIIIGFLIKKDIFPSATNDCRYYFDGEYVIFEDGGEKFINPLPSLVSLINNFGENYELGVIHGDLNLNNIMFDESEEYPLRVIDFEKMRVGHKLTDIAAFETHLKEVFVSRLTEENPGKSFEKTALNTEKIIASDIEAEKQNKELAFIIKLISQIRNLIDEKDLAQYYALLSIHSLSYLKFKSLSHSRSKYLFISSLYSYDKYLKLKGQNT